MRLATIRLGDVIRGAVVEGDAVYPLPDLLTVNDLVEGGLERALEAGDVVVEVAPSRAALGR